MNEWNTTRCKPQVTLEARLDFDRNKTLLSKWKNNVFGQMKPGWTLITTFEGEQKGERDPKNMCPSWQRQLEHWYTSESKLCCQKPYVHIVHRNLNSDRLRLITDKCNSFASRGYSDQLVIFWVYSYINQGCHPAAALSWSVEEFCHFCLQSQLSLCEWSLNNLEKVLQLPKTKHKIFFLFSCFIIMMFWL